MDVVHPRCAGLMSEGRHGVQAGRRLLSRDMKILTFDMPALCCASIGTDERAVMTRGSVLFLRAVVVLIAVGAAALMLWEPHVEGVNAQATNFEIYFKDPFLAYAYVASIPLFVGLYQGFRVLGYVGQDAVLSTAVVRRLRTIKLCAMVMIGFVVGAELFIRLNKKGDDPAGGVFIGILIAFAATVVATTMFVLERTLQSAVDIKSENDLTV